MHTGILEKLEQSLLFPPRLLLSWGKQLVRMSCRNHAEDDGQADRHFVQKISECILGFKGTDVPNLGASADIPYTLG